jgi:hypothetical protein
MSAARNSVSQNELIQRIRLALRRFSSFLSHSTIRPAAAGNAHLRRNTSATSDSVS